jgi:Vitamin K-dependent gamma-carboxylase
MTVEQAIRYAEMIVAFAFALQSLEFLSGLRAERIVGAARLVLSILLFFNFHVVIVEAALFMLALILLHRFRGPYNGGSDTMSLLLLVCLWLSHIVPTLLWQEVVLGYLSFQLTLSYFQAGWVKLTNSEWRNGRALGDVFAFSAYPVSENLRNLARSPRLMLIMSWLVILFELLFSFSLINQTLLFMALGIAMTFHLANAFLFGLNRFFWIWLGAYPVIIWFQQRLFN